MFQTFLCSKRAPLWSSERNVCVSHFGFVLTNYLSERKSTLPRHQKIYGFTFVAQVSKCSTKFLSAFLSPLCNKLRKDLEKIGVSSQALRLNEYSKHMVLSAGILR